MTKVGELSAQVQAIIDNISGLTISITNSYNNLNTRATSGPLTNDVNTQSQIDNLEQKAEAADREFEEAKYKFHGKKSRKQTLQEFVILFFFVAYALFTVSLVLYANVTGTSIAKTLILMAFILLVVSGLILRYA